MNHPAMGIPWDTPPIFPRNHPIRATASTCQLGLAALIGKVSRNDETNMWRGGFFMIYPLGIWLGCIPPWLVGNGVIYCTMPSLFGIVQMLIKSSNSNWLLIARKTRPATER